MMRIRTLGEQAYGESRLRSARDRAAVHQHVLQRDLACILHAHGDHGEAVADEDDVHAGMIGDVGGGEVVGGDHGHGLVPAVQRLQGVDRHLLARRGRRRAHGRMRAIAHLHERQQQGAPHGGWRRGAQGTREREQTGRGGTRHSWPAGSQSKSRSLKVDLMKGDGNQRVGAGEPLWAARAEVFMRAGFVMFSAAQARVRWSCEP